MTCIVGLIDKDRVWIGADSLGISGYEAMPRSDAKVFFRDRFLIGYTSSFRMGQLLRFTLQVPLQADSIDDFEYMATTFVNSVRQCLKDGGYATKDREQESGGCFLVGYRHKLYSIESDYQVGIPSLNYHAVGCGAQVALGAMYAMSEQKSTPKQKIEQALSAAALFNAGVREPFEVLSQG